MRFIHKRPRQIRFDTWQADLEASLQEIVAVGRPEIDLGVDGKICGKPDLLLIRSNADRADEAGRPAGGEKLFGLVPARLLPGGESLMSNSPSSLCEAPSRPPVVWVLPV